MTTRITVHPASHPVEVTHTEGARTHKHMIEPGGAEYSFHIHSGHEAHVREIHEPAATESPDGLSSINLGNLTK